jgi:hypothetical protein
MYPWPDLRNDPDLVRLCADRFERRLGELLHRRECRAINRGKDFVRSPLTKRLYPVCEEVSAQILRTECRAYAAQNWWEYHRFTLPAWAWKTSLPVSHAAVERMTYDLDDTRRCLLGYYAASLGWEGFDYQRHPSFTEVCCGITADKACPDNVRADLAREFPPRPLAGLEVGSETYELPDGPVTVLAGALWTSRERVAAKLAELVRDRQKWAEMKLTAERRAEVLAWFDADIASYAAIYPDMFA